MGMALPRRVKCPVLPSPYCVSWASIMPQTQPETDPDNERLSRIIHRLTEHVQLIDSAMTEERIPLVWHELERLTTFLNGVLETD